METPKKYAIIQDGNCIWGTGETIDDCIKDSNEWAYPDQQILLFTAAYDQPVPTDKVAFILSCLARSSPRRFHIDGDLFITDDPEVIAEYTPSLHQSEWDAFVSNCSRYKRH